MTLEQLNALSRADFVDHLGWIFEDSPWVAERAWEHRPFASLEALHASMVAEVERATRDEQIALLRAHPDLGARHKLSAASEQEQAGAGVRRMDSTWIAAYSEKFGFPFVYAVKGSTGQDVLEALTVRTENDPEEEFHAALFEVYRIARFRLEEATA